MMAKDYPPGYYKKDRSGIYVRTANPEGWRLKHHLIWEAVNGPIPKGFTIKFVDGDNSNLTLNNLMLMSGVEHMRQIGQRNRMPLGTEKLDGHQYAVVKVAYPDFWRLKHHVIWEAANGPIPDGLVVVFKDGDKTNFRLNNLELMTLKKFGSNIYKHFEYPIGAEVTWQNKAVVIKVSAKKWRFKHHLIWEAAHGPVPKGHSIWFADKNTQNFSLNNLVLVSQEEHGYMLKKKMMYYEGDIFKTVVNVAKLGLAINKRRPQKVARTN